MSRSFLQIPVLILFITFFIISCGSKKNIDNNLPKDISERPADEDSQKYDQAQLDGLKAEIENTIAKEKCNNPNEWKYAPMGSKSCGGPKSYIAYSEKSESYLLPKIESYNRKEKDFNTKYGIASDCSLVAEPTAIKCRNGKAELIYTTE